MICTSLYDNLIPMNRGKSILVVDDDPENHFLFELLLSSYFKISFAENGEEGFKAFNNVGADLILTDYEMPVRNGLWLLRRIQEVSPETPVIIVSSSFDISESELHREGASRLIRKPFSPEALLSSIAKLI